jgi:hypothetical protein
MRSPRRIPGSVSGAPHYSLDTQEIRMNHGDAEAQSNPDEKDPLTREVIGAAMHARSFMVLSVPLCLCG